MVCLTTIRTLSPILLLIVFADIAEERIESVPYFVSLFEFKQTLENVFKIKFCFDPNFVYYINDKTCQFR